MLEPVSGVNTIRINDTGEYATLERSVDELTVYAGAGGALRLKSDNKVIIQKEGTTRIMTDSNGIGFFGATPVAQQSKVASPAADPAQIVTAFDELQTLLANYGLLS